MNISPTLQADVITLAQFSPTSEQIAAAWNANVMTRAHELETKSDVCYFTVIVPYIYSFFREQNLPAGATILDLGCGLGHLTHFISSWGFKVIGIDIADKAIEYAKGTFEKVHFEFASITDYANLYPRSFDICVANMVLHNIPDIKFNLESIQRLLKPSGKVIASIPNPKVWYRTHLQHDQFNYEIPEVYEVPFRIRGGIQHPSPIAYFHRPTELYKELIRSSGIKVLNSRSPKNQANKAEEDLVFCTWKKI